MPQDTHEDSVCASAWVRCLASMLDNAPHDLTDSDLTCFKYFNENISITFVFYFLFGNRFIDQTMQVLRVELESDVCDTLPTVNGAIACTVSALIYHSYFSHLISAPRLSRQQIELCQNDGNMSVLLTTKVITGSVIIESDRLASRYRPMISVQIIN